MPTASRLSSRGLRCLWVAAHLHDVSTSKFSAFAERHVGQPIEWRRAWDATQALQARSSWRDKPGPQRSGPPPEADEMPDPALWKSMVVDERALGLELVLFRLPNNGLPRPELKAHLESLVGIRQVMEVSSDREILAIAIVRDRAEAEDLRAQIQDYAVDRPVVMDALLSDSHLPARRTWLELAARELREAS